MSQRQSTLPTILLVEPDDAVRPILTENLRRWGYEVIVALDEADAIQRTVAGRHPFNLLLLNQFKASIEQVIDSGRTICHRADHPRSIPIVIMAEQYGVELEGQTIQVSDNAYVTYLEDAEQLKQLLYRLCPV